MKIHFMTETEAQRWVLLPIAESLAVHIKGSSISNGIDNQAHWNVFINYALYENTSTKTAALFTHRERRGPLQRHFDNVARKVDWCFAMSNRTAGLLPPGKTTLLPMYPFKPFYKNRLILGVVGRGYSDSGRKRMGWIKDLEAIEGVTVKVTGGKIPAAGMPGFYRSIDYLVVLADNEGGPMPVLEALAMGVPVIAPDVGFCWEYPVLQYGSKGELLYMVSRLVIKNGWKVSAEALEEQCRRLL